MSKYPASNTKSPPGECKTCATSLYWSKSISAFPTDATTSTLLYTAYCKALE